MVSIAFTEAIAHKLQDTDLKPDIMMARIVLSIPMSSRLLLRTKGE
jgi:hypothetical protein